MVKAREEKNDCLEEKEKMGKRLFYSSLRMTRKIVFSDRIEPGYGKFYLLLGPVF